MAGGHSELGDTPDRQHRHSDEVVLRSSFECIRQTSAEEKWPLRSC